MCSIFFSIEPYCHRRDQALSIFELRNCFVCGLQINQMLCYVMLIETIVVNVNANLTKSERNICKYFYLKKRRTKTEIYPGVPGYPKPPKNLLWGTGVPPGAPT